MPVPAWLIRPGTVPYDVGNAAMHRLAERRLADEIPDTVILLEHPPVFTAGRRAKVDELLWSPQEVEARGGLVRMIDRGGSFTYHGPGQLVGYPILGLGSRPDAVDYLRRLEEAVIGICGDVGVASERRADVQTGVWVGNDKICAIGVRLMGARVTLHGFALNCETDLSWFRGIVACGLPEHGQTSLSDQLGRRVSVADVLPLAERHLAEVFDLSFQPAPAEIVSPFQVADAV
jgi:lipoyl(octanoyl) transferase